MRRKRKDEGCEGEGGAKAAGEGVLLVLEPGRFIYQERTERTREMKSPKQVARRCNTGLYMPLNGPQVVRSSGTGALLWTNMANSAKNNKPWEKIGYQWFNGRRPLT